jgi:hypothetical protein
MVCRHLNRGQELVSEIELGELNLGQPCQADFRQESAPKQGSRMLCAKIVNRRAARAGADPHVESIELITIPVQQVKAAVIE